MLSRQDLHYEGIVEARMASSRLPGKMLMAIGGKAQPADTYGEITKGSWVIWNNCGDDGECQ